MTTPTFGDHVRIKDNAETRGLGLSRREGQVFGFTTPSITGVPVIGSPTEDYAINVHFEDVDGEFWFASELVEFVDHSPGTVVALDGQESEWVRLANGEWVERSRSKPTPP